MAEWTFSRTCVYFLLLAAGLAFPMVGCVDANVDVPDYYRDEDHHTRRGDDWEDRDHRKDDRDYEHERRKEKEYKKPKHKKLSKKEAYEIAKGLVESRGMEPDRFKIKDRKINNVYWVLFERKHKKSRGHGRRRNHFAVRVARGPRGRTPVTLYTDGQKRDFSRRMDKDKVKKKEAYQFAKQMAHDYGVSPRNYEIKDKKIDGNYWVVFEDERPQRGRAWKNHFAVRVSKYGVVTFYK
jgi:hypothetical protein